MYASFPCNVGLRESLLSCSLRMDLHPHTSVTEHIQPSNSKATFHPRILGFPFSLRKTLSERAVHVLLFFLAFILVNHSGGGQICQEIAGCKCENSIEPASNP